MLVLAMASSALAVGRLGAQMVRATQSPHIPIQLPHTPPAPADACGRPERVPCGLALGKQYEKAPLVTPGRTLGRPLTLALAIHDALHGSGLPLQPQATVSQGSAMPLVTSWPEVPEGGTACRALLAVPRQ